MLLLLPYTATTHTPLFYELLPLFLYYSTELAQGYIPNIPPTSKNYHKIVGSEEMILQKAMNQHGMETNEMEPNAEFAKESSAVTDDNNTNRKNNSQKKVGLIVRVTSRMINYCARELKLIFQKELENEQLPQFSRILMKLNVSVLRPRIHNVTIPRFSYKVYANNTAEMILRGGSARLLGFYRAVYRTVREGQLEANMSNFLTTLKLKITTTFAGKLLLENIACGAEVRSIDVKLIPKLHELVDEGLRMELDEMTSVAICEMLESYMSKLEERLNKFMRLPLIDVKVNGVTEHLLIDTTISNDIILSENYFDFPMLGIPTVSNVEEEIHPLMKSPEDKSKMVYVYVSEYLLNAFLRQLDILGDTTIQLHTEPEFQEILHLKCLENVECMGDFLQDADLYESNSGRLIIKLRPPPIVSIQDGFAIIDLTLKASISYKQKNVDVKTLEFEWLVTLRISEDFLNERLTQKDETIRKTNETLQLMEMAIDKMTPHVEMVPNFVEHLLRLLKTRKNTMEKLITQQCAMIKIIPYTLYKTVSRIAIFRTHTMVIATGLEWNPILLHHFSLFN